MEKNNSVKFSIDKENKKINVEKEFAAPLQKVWDAWTKSEQLDQWWAPKPWKARTKSMDFRAGGTWLYAMVGPDGTTHWSKADYNSIEPMKNFSASDAFCDENGNATDEFPGSTWSNTFSEHSGLTTVDIEISFKSAADLEKILETGFKEGFTMGLGNLDELLGL